MAKFSPMLAVGAEETWQSQPDDFVAVLSAAAVITLPDIGYRLVSVLVEAGATPGSLSIAYDGISKAHFPTGSNATSGSMRWAVTWAFRGTVLPATLFTFTGGVAQATLVFSKGKSRGPDVSAYRAIRFTVTTVAAHATPTAFAAGTYDIAPAIPLAGLAFSTVVGGNVYWPQIGTAQGGGHADSQPSAATLHKAPRLPKAVTLTPLYTNTTAAGTIDFYVGYEPQ